MYLLHVSRHVKRNQYYTMARFAHIVSLFDFDVENGAPFLVMDYALHGSLADLHSLLAVLSLPVIHSFCARWGRHFSLHITCVSCIVTRMVLLAESYWRNRFCNM